MKKVFFATRARGFFKHLFASKDINYNFEYNKSTLYELNNSSRKFLSKLVRSKLFDILGIIQVIKVENKKAVINGSYNRFLKSTKPYFIYVENPTALYHYSLDRNRSKLGKIKVKKLLNDKNLKAIICMSKACYDTFDTVCGVINYENTIKDIIYPLVPKNRLVTREVIESRCKNNEINLLFIAQGIRFVSKGGLEVIEAFDRLVYDGRNVNLTMVTSIKDLDDDILKRIKNNKKINLLDFNLSFEEMENLYAKHTILLQPTSDDSSPLTILEAIKAGLPIIATRLYSIPEMVNDGVNGYLTDPKWWFFDKNHVPNPDVWNNRKSTLYSKKVSNRIVNFIYEKVSYLDENRGILTKMSYNSYKTGNSKPFNEDTIVNSWNKLLSSIE